LSSSWMRRNVETKYCSIRVFDFRWQENSINWSIIMSSPFVFETKKVCHMSKIFLVMRWAAAPFKSPNRRWHIPLLATPWCTILIGAKSRQNTSIWGKRLRILLILILLILISSYKNLIRTLIIVVRSFKTVLRTFSL
jgi:hypothetical protein